MWVSKVNELIGSSHEGFEQAAREVITRANRTLRGITGIEVIGHLDILVDQGSVTLEEKAGIEYARLVRPCG